MPAVVVVGGGALGGDKVLRLEPCGDTARRPLSVHLEAGPHQTPNLLAA